MSLKERLESYLSEYEKGYDHKNAIRYLHQRDLDLWDEIVSATEFLGESPLPKQRCWHILNESYERPVCKYTGDLVAWQGSRYREFNGKGSNNSDPLEQNRRKDLFLSKYGVVNPAQASECRLKQEQTNLERYGHTNYLASSKGIQDVKNSWADPERKAKRLEAIHQTFREKFGGFPYQNPEIFMKAMKNGFKYRDYAMPSGKIVKIQGYEDMTLDELIAAGIEEKDILTAKNEVPEIWFEFEGRKRRYYPDILVVSQNRIIEVKSTFTYRYEEAKNLAKKEACIAAGFLFEFRIYPGRPK